MECCGVKLCTDGSHVLKARAAPWILPANIGMGEADAYWDQLPAELRNVLPTGRVQHDKDHALLLQMDARSSGHRAIFCPTDLSDYYVERYGPGGEGARRAWRDFYYATFYAALAIIDRDWAAKVAYLTHITNICRAPEDMLEAQLDALAHAKERRVSKVEQLCMHHIYSHFKEALQEAVQAKRADLNKKPETKFRQAEPPIETASGKLTVWEVEVPPLPSMTA